MPFSANKINIGQSKLMVVPIDGSIANKKNNLPYDRVISNSRITGIQWLDGGFEVPATGTIGGNDYTFLSSTNTPSFILTMRDKKGGVIIQDAALSTFSKPVNKGKIRRTNIIADLPNCFIKFTTVSAGLPANAALLFKIYFEPIK